MSKLWAGTVVTALGSELAGAVTTVAWLTGLPLPVSGRLGREAGASWGPPEAELGN